MKKNLEEKHFYHLVVRFDNERDLQALFERLRAEGYFCKICII